MSEHRILTTFFNSVWIRRCSVAKSNMRALLLKSSHSPCHSCQVQIGRYVLKHRKDINEDGKIEGMLEPHSSLALCSWSQGGNSRKHRRRVLWKEGSHIMIILRSPPWPPTSWPLFEGCWIWQRKGCWRWLLKRLLIFFLSSGVGQSGCGDEQPLTQKVHVGPPKPFRHFVHVGRSTKAS